MLRKGLLALSLTLSGLSYADISYFKGAGNPNITDTCFRKDGCLDLKQPITINVGLEKKVSLGYLLSILSSQIHYPVLLRCGDEENTCANVKISYYADKKPLLQVLKEISSLAGLYVKITPQGVVFYRYEEATFHIPLPQLDKDIVIEDKGKGKEDFLAEYKRDYLGKLEDKLKALLHSKFASLSVSPKGYVFVRGTHEEVEAVKRAVEKITKNLNREIKLKMDVFLIDVSNGDESGINWTELVRDKDFMQLSFIGLTNFGSQNYMSFTAKGGDIKNLLFQLSKQKGKVKLISSNTFRVLNTQPLYFSPTTKQRIISKYELSYIQVGTGTAETTQPTLTVDTEDLESGEKLLIVPYFVDKDKIAIEFVRKYSQIDKILEKTVNLEGYENEVALPQITSLVNTGQSVLNKGDSLVLVSSAITQKQLQKEGIPFLQDIPLLGRLFSYTKNHKRKFRIIITITYEK
jgi:hypothetical protein